MNWIISILIPVYEIGILFNAIIIVYIAIFRKGFKEKIREVARSTIKDQLIFYYKDLPKSIFKYLFRILGSWFTFNGFLIDLEKAEKYSLYSFKEIKEILIKVVLFLTIMPTLGLFIYLLENYIQSIGILTYMFYCMIAVISIFILMLIFI